LLQVARQLEQRSFSFLLPPLGDDALGCLDDDGDDASGRAVILDHGAVVKIHPDVFGGAVAEQNEFLVLVGQRAAREASVDDVAIEIGNLWPALLDGRPEQKRMAAARENRIGVVVDHMSSVPPQHHERYGRREH